MQVWYSWGRKLASENNTDGAIEKFTKAHQKNPQHAETLYRWGLLLQDDNPKEAQVKLWGAREAANRTNGKLAAEILIDLANILNEVKEQSAAIVCLKEAGLLDPGNPRSFWDVGFRHAEREEWKDATKAFETANCLSSGMDKYSYRYIASALVTWAEATFELSKLAEQMEAPELLDKALLLCRRAATFDPQDHSVCCRAYHTWGLVEKEKGAPNQAIDTFTKADEMATRMAERGKRDNKKVQRVCEWVNILVSQRDYTKALNKLRRCRLYLQDLCGNGENSNLTPAEYYRSMGDLLNVWAMMHQNQGNLGPAATKFREAADAYHRVPDHKAERECRECQRAAQAGVPRAPRPPHALWRAYQQATRPVELEDAQRLWQMAMEDGHLSPGEEEALRRILAGDALTQEAREFLNGQWREHREGQERRRDRSRSRGRESEGARA